MVFHKTAQPKRVPIEFKIPKIADPAVCRVQLHNAMIWHQKTAEDAFDKRDRFRHRAIAQRISETLDG